MATNIVGATGIDKVQDGIIVNADIDTVDAGKLTGTVADARISTLTASKLTGALPAISGASLTGVGVAGISSSADATAMTITSAEKIGIGTTSPDSIVEIEGASPILTITDTDASGDNFGLWLRELGSHGMPTDGTAYGAFLGYHMADNKFQIKMRNGSTTYDALTIARADGKVYVPGHVLQVINAVRSTEVTSNSSTYADTGLTATITPSSTSSKILVMSSNDCTKYGADTWTNIRCYRGGTEIGGTIIGRRINDTDDSGKSQSVFSFTILDSPSTTSATVYKTQFNTNSGGGTIRINAGSGSSTMCLMEIGA